MASNERRSILFWVMVGALGCTMFVGATKGASGLETAAVGPLPIEGDADCSETVDIHDVLEVRRIDAELVAPGQCASDADGNGDTNSVDALCLLRQLSGLFPSCGPGFQGFSVTFFDVGQGDAALITVGDANMLIDAGASGSVILQRLQAHGITDLGAIVATHLDADHIGGFADVLAGFSVERIYLNGESANTQTDTTFLAAVNAEPGAEVITLHRNDSVKLGGLVLPVLHPATLVASSNDDSVVLGLTCGAVKLLFMGDAETPSESSLLGASLVSNIDVIKLGHHGSDSASSLTFLQAADPEVAVISAGLANQYGHPDQTTLDRLGSVGSRVVSTDTSTGDDSVTMTSDCADYSFSVTPVPPVTSTPTSTSTSTSTPTGTNSPTSTPTNTPTATPTTGTCESATADILGLDKSGEIVTLTGSGNLTGWTLKVADWTPDIHPPCRLRGNRNVHGALGDACVHEHPDTALVDLGERLEQRKQR